MTFSISWQRWTILKQTAASSTAAVIQMVTVTGSDLREAPQPHNPNIYLKKDKIMELMT